MKLYHLSDLHLGIKPGAFEGDIYTKLVYENLKRVCEKAVEEKASFVLIAGDVFDSNYLSSSIAINFLKFLKEFSELNFILIPGGGGEKREEIQGHDAYTQDSIYRRPEVKILLSDNIYLLTPENPVQSFPKENIAFYGGFFDFPKSPLITGINRHVALIHGAFGEREDFGEIAIYPSIEQRFDYLALGHYHRFKKVSEKAFYSGAFIQFEFPPSGVAESGYVEVFWKGSELKVKRKVLPQAPRYEVIKVFTEEDLAKLKSYLAEEKAFNFIKVSSYLEDFKDDLTNLAIKHKGKFTLDPNALVTRKDLFYTEILEGILTEKVPEELKQEVRDFLLYGLQVSARKRDLEKFLLTKYTLE